jgi:hypothetical protein
LALSGSNLIDQQAEKVMSSLIVLRDLEARLKNDSFSQTILRKEIDNITQSVDEMRQTARNSI